MKRRTPSQTTARTGEETKGRLPGVQLPSSALIAARLRFLPEAGSTNDELLGMARDAAEPHLSVVATASQTAGRGRLGRTWVAPPGKTLAVSVLLRPRAADGTPLTIEHFGWLPLLAGVAMTVAVDAVVGNARTTLKWPNDVHVDGQKVSGILAELLSTGDGVVIGAGVNLTLSAEELPVPTATSLALAGVQLAAGFGPASDELVDLVLARYLGELRDLVERLADAGGDAGRSGIRTLVSGFCSTLGRPVRVQLPGGTDLLGIATELDEDGRLIVRASDGTLSAVAAGDVTHLRYE